MDTFLDEKEAALVRESFRNSQNRLILLDYDGTLVPYNCEPSMALPGKSLMKLLHRISSISNLSLVIISGRHKAFLNNIFHDLKATIFGEHGAVYRIDNRWASLKNDLSWQAAVTGIIKDAVESIPGSWLEKKENSVVWHYRKADLDLAGKKIIELIDNLSEICNENNLTIMKGRKIVEVKPSEYTKGTAILNFFDCSCYDFILAAGDDVTDEDLFEALPLSAVTIHVGKSSDIASHTIKNSDEFVKFLSSLI